MSDKYNSKYIHNYKNKLKKKELKTMWKILLQVDD